MPIRACLTGLVKKFAWTEDPLSVGAKEMLLTPAEVVLIIIIIHNIY